MPHKSNLITVQPYTTYFPRADIHELITPDLLHQAIKVVYKDHLVAWVSEYLEHYHGAANTEQILDEIDHRSVRFLVCSMTRIRDFPESCSHPHSQAYGGLNRGEISISGPEMIQRR